METHSGVASNRVVVGFTLRIKGLPRSEYLGRSSGVSNGVARKEWLSLRLLFFCSSWSGQWTELFHSLGGPHCNEVPGFFFPTLPSGPQQPSRPRTPCPRFLAC